MKFIYLAIAFALFLVGCQKVEKKALEDSHSTAVPPDVPIAKSDSNISIDRDFPPTPVAE